VNGSLSFNLRKNKVKNKNASSTSKIQGSAFCLSTPLLTTTPQIPPKTLQYACECTPERHMVQVCSGFWKKQQEKNPQVSGFLEWPQRMIRTWSGPTRHNYQVLHWAQRKVSLYTMCTERTYIIVHRGRMIHSLVLTKKLWNFLAKDKSSSKEEIAIKKTMPAHWIWS